MVRSNTGRRPRIVHVVNADWFFLSHRLPLARAVQEAGGDVIVMTPDTGRGNEIRGKGFEFVPIPLSRSGLSPLQEARTISALALRYLQTRADLIHHSTIKPVVYGSIAARSLRRSVIVNTVSGFGYSLTGAGDAPTSLGPFVSRLLRVALSHPRSRSIFQNPDDRDEFVRRGVVSPGRAVLIRGSGVDCRRFRPADELAGTAVVILPSRMLWDKGVAEFVGAAERVRSRRDDVRFALVGDTDPGNPRAVPASRLRAWEESGIVEWWGHRGDMPDVFRRATLVALPSYREGLPKALLEAAASGRAIVATDVPGCREIVRHEVNGLLVPPRDPAALAMAIEALLDRPDLRARFGAAGRTIVTEEFDVRRVVRRTLQVYDEALGRRVFGA